MEDHNSNNYVCLKNHTFKLKKKLKKHKTMERDGCFVSTIHEVRTNLDKNNVQLCFDV